jgi:MazG family protein
MEKSMNREKKTFQELVDVIALLRDPVKGCPWDLEQTHASLKPYMIEEAYEAIDAIDNNPSKLSEELGDVLLQVVLHSQVGKDAGTFDISDVVDGLTNKLIARHPHIFGDTQVSSSKEVLKNWEEIKKKSLKEGASILDGVPRSMPGLLRAQRLGEKAARVGFDWSDIEGVKQKVIEEINEFVEASLRHGDGSERMQEEFGDVLFSLAQLARKSGLNGEDILAKANDKFTARFKEMEKIAGGELKGLSTEKLEDLWDQAKKRTGKGGLC